MSGVSIGDLGAFLSHTLRDHGWVGPDDATALRARLAAAEAARDEANRRANAAETLNSNQRVMVDQAESTVEALRGALAESVEWIEAMTPASRSLSLRPAEADSKRTAALDRFRALASPSPRPTPPEAAPRSPGATNEGTEEWPAEPKEACERCGNLTRIRVALCPDCLGKSSTSFLPSAPRSSGTPGAAEDEDDVSLRRCRFCGQRGRELCIATSVDFDVHEADCAFNPANKHRPDVAAYWRYKHAHSCPAPETATTGTAATDAGRCCACGGPKQIATARLCNTCTWAPRAPAVSEPSTSQPVAEGLVGEDRPAPRLSKPDSSDAPAPATPPEDAPAEDAEFCSKSCDHGSPCLLYADHQPPDRHETQHGCVFYDPKGTT